MFDRLLTGTVLPPFWQTPHVFFEVSLPGALVKGRSVHARRFRGLQARETRKTPVVPYMGAARTRLGKGSSNGKNHAWTLASQVGMAPAFFPYPGCMAGAGTPARRGVATRLHTCRQQSPRLGDFPFHAGSSAGLGRRARHTWKATVYPVPHTARGSVRRDHRKRTFSPCARVAGDRKTPEHRTLAIRSFLSHS